MSQFHHRASTDQEPADLEDLLDRFDEAWRSGAPPRIDDFLARVPVAEQASKTAARRKALEELVKFDLEYRWRSTPTLGQPWALEDYVARYSELGPIEHLPAELIGEEYRVRKCWGDRPGHAIYLAHFPAHGAELAASLRRIDVELAAEFAREGRIMPSSPHDGFSGSGGSSRPALAQPVFSVGDLLEELRRYPLMIQTQLNDLILGDLQGRYANPSALAEELLQRSWLTPYQVNQLYQGRGSELVLGPYVVLERLGEGGAGQVFKARHSRMNRLVAVKVIREELLDDLEVVGRFCREVQLVAKLSHPHVVQAYDAGPVGTKHVLVMEHVEGTNLAQLVKENGPLPVASAVEYVRQAALGLEHAHEQGLVHRDIKPANLLLAKASQTPSVVIKILDFGLARLRKTTDGDLTSVITPTGGVMMGTPDYLAPEQALNFHGADIRADIYSLGCTLYYLLTGQAPFAGGTMAEKLLKHQQLEPTPVEQFRSDVPPGLSVTLRKMLAKRPEDRYQTPAEAADALSRLRANGGGPAGSPVVREVMAQTIVTADGGPPVGRRKRRRLVGAAIGVGLLGILAISASKLFPTSGTFSTTPTAAASSSTGASETANLLFHCTLNDAAAVRGPAVGTGVDSAVSISAANDFVAGKVGRGIRINAPNKHVRLPQTDGKVRNVDLTRGTVDLWYQPGYDHTDPPRYPIVSIGSWGSPGSVHFEKNSAVDAGHFSVYTWDAKSILRQTHGQKNSYSWKAGEWVRIQVTWDSTVASGMQSVHVYINGREPTYTAVQAGPFPMPQPAPGGSIYLGGRGPAPGGAGLFANGVLDEVKIFDRPIKP